GPGVGKGHAPATTGGRATGRWRGLAPSLLAQDQRAQGPTDPTPIPGEGQGQRLQQRAAQLPLPPGVALETTVSRLGCTAGTAPRGVRRPTAGAPLALRPVHGTIRDARGLDRGHRSDGRTLAGWTASGADRGPL